MAYNINQEAINFQCNDIAQFSTKTLEDYSIVSRKKLEKIIKNSERRLVNNFLNIFLQILCIHVCTICYFCKIPNYQPARVYIYRV
jgi:hypothetical protein